MLVRLLKTQRAAFSYFLLVVCLPIVTLVILGVIQLWQNSWLLPVTLAWLIATVIGYAIYWIISKNQARKLQASKTSLNELAVIETPTKILDDDNQLPLEINEKPHWSTQDTLVWQYTVQLIEQLLDNEPSWEQLPEAALELLGAVSHCYQHGIDKTSKQPIAVNQASSFQFTAPELLLLTSETATRYRQLLLSHIPYVDSIKLSSMLSLYSKQGQIRQGASWLNNARRAARFVNPLAAVIAELRDQFTGQLFASLSNKVQRDLKRLLLQELVQVSMDLYSGRLKSSNEELEQYQSAAFSQDLTHTAQLAEPLRVVIVGQVSAGKSSLINALSSQLNAETDILPTTDHTTVHKLCLQIEDEQEPSSLTIHLVDTVGITSETGTIESLAESVASADIVVWCAKATQSARAPDAELYNAIKLIFDSQPARIVPPIVLALTHVDQLSPKASWEPPYDLNSDNPKAVNMVRAIDSCRKQTGLPESTVSVPLSIGSSHTQYNVDALNAEILALRDTATQVQFNRRRVELNTTPTSWQARWQQAQALGRKTGKVLVNSTFK